MGEPQIIISDLQGKRLDFTELFQIATVIEKLSPSWKNFKYYLIKAIYSMSLFSSTNDQWHIL